MDKGSENFPLNESENFDKISRPLIISTIIVILITILLGTLNYFHTQANITKEAYLNLENISNSKISSINYWRKDKIDDAKLIMNDISHKSLLINYKEGNSSETQVKLWMKSLLNHEDIIEVILYDSNKNPLIFTGEKEFVTERERGDAYDKCLKTKDVVVSDFFVENDKNLVRISIFIPVFNSINDKNEVCNVLMMDFDPDKYLEKFVTEWPIHTESSEACLVRDDGKDVVYLSDVKGTVNSSLKFKISKEDTSVVSVKAVLGLRGRCRAYDYAKKEVYAVINAVPGTNWILITKTNADEIVKNSMVTGVFTFMITFVIIVLALFVTYFFNRKNKAQFFMAMYNKELQKNIQLERFNVLLNNAYDCIILYDSKGNILDANTRALETYGYRLEEIKKLNVVNIRAPENRMNIKDIIESLKHSEGMIIETVHQTKSGKIFPVEVSASRIDFEGKTYLQGISRDISSRKEFEKLLIESEEKFKSVFTYANDVMFILDGCNLISVNKNAESLFGYKNEEMIKMTPAEISPEFQEDGCSSKSKSEDYINKALNGEPQFFEWIHKNSDGVEFPTEVSLNAIIINNKKYVFTVLRDITFRKILDETLKDKEKSLELALDGSELGYYDMNLETGKVITNQTCYRMLGYDETDITQHRDWWRELMHKDDIERSKKIWEDHLSGKKDLYEMEVRMKKKDGDFIWILDKSKIFETNSDGSALRVVGTHMDISQRKSYEEAILRAKESAEESNSLKSNFLTNMSHELRTPLTGILGFSELLSSELENEEQKEMADLIFKGGKRLTNTLNSILDLSRLESNQLAVSKSIINLVKLLEESIELYRKSALMKGLYVNFECNYEVIECNIDEKMTYDIVYNLLQNSITYTNEGGITVSLDLHKTDECDFARLSVRDTGIGINPKFHKQIFEPFRQASEGLSRKFEGTGLGLTLTKKFTEMMGGEIKVISEEGNGADFIITLPLLRYTKISSQTFEEINAKKEININAIFVEDEIENYELVNMLLRPYMNLENYTSSTEALEIIKKRKYDIIFMDIGLKDINGIEATKIIRKLDNYKDTPIIAITAFAMIGDKEKILESGCNEYISKPFTKEQLFDALKKYIKLEE